MTDLPVPRGYERAAYPSDSFSGWLQRLPLKNNTTVLTHNGGAVPSRRYNRTAVIDMPLLFSDDLEQCADYCMRFWGEFHRQTGRLEELFLFTYPGERTYFSKSGSNFKQFLRIAFAYSNSYSLKAGCKPVGGGEGRVELMPGDMFVQNETGGIGHVSMVMDAAKNRSGEQLYQIGFSFMPAQEFHIETAPSREYGIGGWFSLEGYVRFLADFYPYGKPVLRRFN